LKCLVNVFVFFYDKTTIADSFRISFDISAHDTIQISSTFYVLIPNFRQKNDRGSKKTMTGITFQNDVSHGQTGHTADFCVCYVVEALKAQFIRPHVQIPQSSFSNNPIVCSSFVRIGQAEPERNTFRFGWTIFSFGLDAGPPCRRVSW